MHILLVEDDALLADGLARSLSQTGYQVELASDGLIADRLLESGSFDLVILDLGLPGLDGRKVVERLRKRKQTMPVLVLSARMDLEERTAAQSWCRRLCGQTGGAGGTGSEDAGPDSPNTGHP
jgi:two-component system OmpR family response regulator